jgi:hypothetical protein
VRKGEEYKPEYFSFLILWLTLVRRGRAMEGRGRARKGKGGQKEI